jgi:hypothetical protein
MNLVLIVFFTSCTRNNANLLNRNENGYEIPRDILFNGEYSSSNTPNYFQKTTIKIFGDTKIIGTALSSNNKWKFNGEYVNCISVKKPGIPFLIYSPDRVSNLEFLITFKKKLNSFDCDNINLNLNKTKKFILIELKNIFSVGTCEIDFIVSTPDKLNQINRNLIFKWGENRDYLCFDNFKNR